MRHHTWTIALATAVLAAGCENSPSTGVEGTYQLAAEYTIDECSGQQGRSFSSEVTIERDGDNVTFLFGDAATLTGTINPEDRVMTVEGTILVEEPDGEGTFTGHMRMVARVTEGEFNGLATITFEGTFPGVPGTCIQAFAAEGERRGNLSPLPLTGS